MANHWLLKTEPGTYSFDQLLTEGRAVWDGVRNNLALSHLRAMKPGDRVFIYHSGSTRAVVGMAKVVTAAYPDPGQDDPKLVVVDLVPEARLQREVPLSAIKSDPSLRDMPLVRISRLSVMPVTPDQWKRILAMAAGR